MYVNEVSQNYRLGMDVARTTGLTVYLITDGHTPMVSIFTPDFLRAKGYDIYAVIL